MPRQGASIQVPIQALTKAAQTLADAQDVYPPDDPFLPALALGVTVADALDDGTGQACVQARFPAYIAGIAEAAAEDLAEDHPDLSTALGRVAENMRDALDKRKRC